MVLLRLLCTRGDGGSLDFFRLLAFFLTLTIICRGLTDQRVTLSVDFGANDATVSPFECLCELRQEETKIKVVLLLLYCGSILCKERVYGSIDLLVGDDHTYTGLRVKLLNIELVVYADFGDCIIDKLYSFIELVSLCPLAIFYLLYECAFPLLMVWFKLSGQLVVHSSLLLGAICDFA